MHPRTLSRAEPVMSASLCDHCVDVSDLLSWSLSRVHFHHLCNSNEQGSDVSDAHNRRTKIFHLSGAGECHPSFIEATAGSVKMFVGVNELTQPQKHKERTKVTQTQTDRQTDRQKTHTNTNTHVHTHTHTHLGDRSATCWARLGGPHNERGTVDTHTQVPTRFKQIRLHVGSPLV
jgi:hypothetical protein